MTRKAVYYICGKEVLLEEKCVNPLGIGFLEHTNHNDGFRKFCLECGKGIDEQ